MTSIDKINNFFETSIQAKIETANLLPPVIAQAAKAMVSCKNSTCIFKHPLWSEMNYHRRHVPPPFRACFDNHSFNHPADRCSFNLASD